MGSIESAVVGYIAGAIVGSLILIFFLGWILVSEGEATPPEFYQNLEQAIRENYFQTNPTIFKIAFVLGFLSGIGGGGTAVNNARNSN